MATFKFSIELKGKKLHRLFEGRADISEGDADAAMTLAGMLGHIVTVDKCAGATSVTATIRKVTPNAEAHASATEGSR